MTDGLVCVLRAVEPCNTFTVKREGGRLEVRTKHGKCLQFYLSVGGPPVKGLLGSPWLAAGASRCQVGAPAAKRGRTSLTPVRSGAYWTALEANRSVPG